jgi:4-hydroxythreonine-4-phosphate dehydrogenase
MNNNIAIITTGDIEGIGLEVLIKALQSQNYNCIPILVGFYNLKNFIKNTFKIEDKWIDYIYDINQKDLTTNRLYIYPIEEIEAVDISEKKLMIDITIKSLDKAIEIVTRDNRKYLITLPLSKKRVNTKLEGFRGHTEYIGKKVGVTDPIMTFYQKAIITSLLTTHLPLKTVSGEISESKILSRIKVLDNFYRQIYNTQPLIAILSLNPHSGDGGILGNEENDIIEPAISSAVNNGYSVEGPFPADSFYSRDFYTDYDIIIAMYHDQGLIPVKMLGPSVNITLGLPFLRLSPDHGPAYDIAFKNSANPESMIAVFELIEKLERR